MATNKETKSHAAFHELLAREVDVALLVPV